MSTTIPVETRVPDDARERVKTARLRAAAVRARLHLATDALAAAHLLLGMHAVQRAADRREPR